MEPITLRPPKPITEAICAVALRGDLLSAKLEEKREDFRKIVKIQTGMDFDWDNRRWVRRLDQFAGEPMHRVVELCIRLLDGGFIITVDPAWAAAIQIGEYEPEQTRWIKRVVSGDYTDWFAIRWGRHEDYYDVAKRLPGSRYDGKAHQVVVPSVQFETVLDFAERRDFSLSGGATELMGIARRKRDEAILVTVVAPKPRKRTVAKDVRPALVASEEKIADEFADDPA